jgi:hypothetical protein
LARGGIASRGHFTLMIEHVLLVEPAISGDYLIGSEESPKEKARRTTITSDCIQ